MQEIFKFLEFTQSDYLNALIILASFLAAAAILKYVVAKIMIRLVKFTKSETDDKIIEILRNPVFFTILLIGIAFANGYLKSNLEADFDLSKKFADGVNHVLYSLIAIFWAAAGIKIGRIILTAALERVGDESGLRKDVYPLADNLIKIAFILGALAAIIAIWNYDVTPLLASAGVASVVIAFAAKDTFANFFGGISVFMDKPYKIGDYINLDTGERGEVVNIGMRSTRIQTRDDIMITIPNSIIANSKVVNESQPVANFRARIPIGVAYGTDADKVEKILMQIAYENENVESEPEPRVRFREFADSSLNFELLCWVAEPALRGLTIHEINKRINVRFAEEGITIPFPQRDVHFFKSDD